MLGFKNAGYLYRTKQRTKKKIHVAILTDTCELVCYKLQLSRVMAQ